MSERQLDPLLRQFATDKQWEYLSALLEHGSQRKAAKALGVDRRVLQLGVKAILKKAAQQGYAPDHDLKHIVPEGLTLRGTSLLYDEAGNIERYWNKTKPQGREPAEVVQLPDPKKIIRTATLYDQQGAVTQQWVTEKAEDAQREALWQECARALAADLPRVTVPEVPTHTRDDILPVYPVGDHHTGMLSWAKETGANYDLSISEKLLAGAVEYLMAKSDPCNQALVPFLGDYLHYDSQNPMTPAHGNLLDADGRFPKMVRVGIRNMRYVIEAAARRHKNVHVIIEPGNHDPYSSIFLMECMRNIYENEPRITIDTSPARFHYFEYGANLIGTHHGDTVKMDKLPGDHGFRSAGSLGPDSSSYLVHGPYPSPRSHGLPWLYRRKHARPASCGRLGGQQGLPFDSGYEGRHVPQRARRDIASYRQPSDGGSGMTTKETIKVFLRDGFTHRCEVVREQEIDRPFSDRTMRCRLGGREFECCVIRGAWSEWSDDNADLSDPQLAALFDSIADDGLRGIGPR